MVVVFLAVVAAIARGGALLDWLLPRALGLATHTQVAIARVSIGSAGATLSGITMTKGDEPLFAARRLAIDYDLRDLLPGSRHRFGLRAVVLDHPVFTLERHADGSYNIALGGGGPPPAAPLRPNGVPLAFTLTVRDGAIALRAPHALDPQARRVDVGNVALTASIDTATRTRYVLTGALDGAPFRARGVVDAALGYAMHHVQAAALTVRPIANFFINSKSAQVLAGTARSLDVTVYALGVAPEAPVAYHLGGTVHISNATMHLVGLGPPVTQMNVDMHMVDDQLFFNDLHGHVAGVSLHGFGSIFDLAGDPQFRIGVHGRGNLADLRKLFAFARDQDLAGDADIGVAVDGGLTGAGPRILATLDSRRCSYRAIAFEHLHASIAYQNSTVLLMPVRAQAQGGATFTIRGALEIDDHVHSKLALHVTTPADALPYAGELLGKEPLAGDFTVVGDDFQFDGYGALQSARSPDRMTAVVHAARGGVLDVAPLWIVTPRGALYGGYHLDRTRDRSAFWIRALHLALRAPAHGTFLDQVLAASPPIDGTLDDAAILGGGSSGEHTIIAGEVRAHATTISGVRFTSLRSRFAGSLADIGIDAVDATGPWGRFRGDGAFTFNGIAVRGRYDGTLEGLRSFMSDVPASGRIDGDVAFALSGERIVVQTGDLRLHDASVHGIPIESASGTLAIDNGALRVESARANVAGGSVVAAGAYDRGIALIATHLDGAHLRALGLPLEAGSVDADGTIAQGAPLPSFAGGVAVAGGRVERFAVAGSGLVTMRGDGARLDHVVGGVDGIYALASGSLGSLTANAPNYDVTAEVPAANISTALADLSIAGHYSEGTFDAKLAIRGAGLTPSVRGVVGAPAGSVNGLYYTGATSLITADTHGVILRDGSVTVGTSRLDLEGSEDPSMSALRLRTAHVNLADFDDFFDTGDTLAGTGRVRFDVVSQRHRISSNGEIAVAGLRYRNFAFGDTSAVWSSEHNLLRGSLDVTGTEGTLHSHGSMDVVPEQAPLDTLRDSSYDLTATVSDFGLSNWIAALGYPQIGVTGRANGSATLHGRYPALQLRADVSLADATVWRLPIDSATGTFSSSRGRLVVDRFDISSPGLRASASGTLGLRPSDPLDMTIHASSDDVPRVAAELWRVQVPVRGSFDATLSLGGTLANATYQAAFNGKDAMLYGVDVPAISASLRLHGNDVLLEDADITLPHGTIALSGSAPLRVNPFMFGPANRPVTLDVEVKGVDPGALDALIGNETKLGGKIDGSLGLSGTVGNPRIVGKFGVTGGSYVSSFERTPITAIDTQLTFSSTAASVDKLQAKFGSGTVSGSGRVAFGSSAGYTVNVAAHGAQLNLPAWGEGTIDGNIALTRAPSQVAKVGGTIELSNATIPFAAFVGSIEQSSLSATVLPPLDLDLHFNVGRNVRVRGTGFGAGLDIAGTGSLHATGSLTDPVLDGTFKATSGTLTYYDRAFRVAQARVVFDPAAGIVPVLHASGITRVTNPDPSSPYSSVDIVATVEGPVNNPRLTFSSNPPGYSNDQILALIAPFGGVLLSGYNYVPGQTSTVNPLVPGAQPIGGTSNATITAGQEAFSILNAQFAAGLLSPLEQAVSQSLGFQSVNLTLDYWGNVGVETSRILGRNVNLIYAATFGISQRTEFGLQLAGERQTSAQLSYFFQTGPQQLFTTAPITSNISSSRLSAGLPLQGQSGFAFTLQRLFW
ncbi:MAG TPA: translocation/assembly module TamB domain-containing protein [Candidatus Acidoferrales bacterium]|nr:translocation/assembly module TamB domain-containing protein [Candidatus Acidoferrales bacterium]